MKRICAFFLAVMLLLTFSVNVTACNEEQTEYYVLQILFGKENIYKYENNNDAEKLLNALYICSEQSNGKGQEELNALEDAKVDNLPSLEKIDVTDNQLIECAHRGWEYENARIKKIKDTRKTVLRETVIKVFNFGWFNENIRSDSGDIDSFSALLYYLHILADYLADDPEDTEFSAKGYDIPAYSGGTGLKLHGDNPNFTSKEKKAAEAYTTPYYSGFDSYKRSGYVLANIGPDELGEVGERQSMSGIKSSGWNQNKYEGIVNTQPPYLYNRCHLLAHQLGGVEEEKNLITGTRFLNEAMIPYENKVSDHVKNTGNHVLYRVTPVYVGADKLASGVQLEAYSIEDNGALSFNVYLYNVQPGIDINYANGSNEQADDLYGKNNILPFAILNPSTEKPDLMYEIEQQLENLFKDQNDFKEKINKLNEISDEIRRNYSNCSSGKEYIKLKEKQYEYVGELSSCVSDLLKEKEFFAEVFKK